MDCHAPSSTLDVLKCFMRVNDSFLLSSSRYVSIMTDSRQLSLSFGDHKSQRPPLCRFLFVRFERACASYPGLSHLAPGFNPLYNARKGEVRNWTTFLVTLSTFEPC